MQRVITDYFPDARPPCRWRQRINTAAIALPLQFHPLASSSATAFSRCLRPKLYNDDEDDDDDAASNPIPR